MSILERIKPLEQFEASELHVYYGPQGTGKTTISATYPQPILFIDVMDKGLDSAKDIDLKVNKFFSLDSNNPTQALDDYDELIEELFEAEEIKSISIDTITQLQDLEVKRLLIKSKRSFLTMQNWQEVSSKMKYRIDRLKILSTIKNVVVLAQERKDDPVDMGDIQLAPEIYPALSPSVSTSLCSNAKILFHTCIKEVEKTVKGKNGQPKTKKIEVYCVQTAGTDIYKGKIQKKKSVKIPVLIPNYSYDKLQELLKK